MRIHEERLRGEWVIGVTATTVSGERSGEETGLRFSREYQALCFWRLYTQSRTKSGFSQGTS